MNFLRMAEVPLAGQRVFIRCDLNVPQDEHGNITEDTRIRASIPAIRMALDKGAAAVMVTSHLGRPTEGALTVRDSLEIVGLRLQELLGVSVILIKDWVDGGFATKPGTVFLLENCRGNVGEKKNDEALAKRMARLCDVWVHDAFGTAHRAEATTYGMGQYAKTACAGPLLAAEFDALGKALSNPARPLVAVVGGSKVSSKLDILSNLADRVDRLAVGGGMANTFLLSQGMPVGKSLVEKDLVAQACAIADKMTKRGAAVWLPTDVVCAKEMTSSAKAEVKEVSEVAPDDRILDVGPESASNLAQLLLKAHTIVWNGPIGVFEMESFSRGTQAVAQAVAASNAFSIAGGGDTLAAIHKFNVSENVSYISTGGGAFLEFLEGKTMPAMEVLTRRAGDGSVDKLN